MTDKNFLRVVVAALLMPSSLIAHAGVIEFDNLGSGDPVTTIDGVTFNSNTGLGLIVSDIFDTTSGFNYLGVDDGGFEVFFPGDIITLAFTDAITSLAVNFISSPVTPGEVFSIDTALGSSTSGLTPDSVLADGGEVFSVSFSSAIAFTTADLLSAGGLYSYNIDDIGFRGVPEPSMLALLGTGLIPLLRLRRSGTNNRKT